MKATVNATFEVLRFKTYWDGWQNHIVMHHNPKARSDYNRAEALCHNNPDGEIKPPTKRGLCKECRSTIEEYGGRNVRVVW